MSTIRNLPVFRDGRAHIYYSILLEGVLYNIKLNFNARDERWYISVHDSQDEPIEGCIGRKMVTNWDLLRGANVDGRPPGQIITNSSSHADPGLLELGARVAVYYLESNNA